MELEGEPSWDTAEVGLHSVSLLGPVILYASTAARWQSSYNVRILQNCLTVAWWRRYFVSTFQISSHPVHCWPNGSRKPVQAQSARWSHILSQCAVVGVSHELRSLSLSWYSQHSEQVVVNYWMLLHCVLVSVCSLGDRAFPVAAARLWNTLPVSLRTVSSYLTFCPNSRPSCLTFHFQTTELFVWLCKVALQLLIVTL